MEGNEKKQHRHENCNIPKGSCCGVKIIPLCRRLFLKPPNRNAFLYPPLFLPGIAGSSMQNCFLWLFLLNLFNFLLKERRVLKSTEGKRGSAFSPTYFWFADTRDNLPPLSGQFPNPHHGYEAMKRAQSQHYKEMEIRDREEPPRSPEVNFSSRRRRTS